MIYGTQSDHAKHYNTDAVGDISACTYQLLWLMTDQPEVGER